jgi:hypothetical protein
VPEQKYSRRPLNIWKAFASGQIPDDYLARPVKTLPQFYPRLGVFPHVD